MDCVAINPYSNALVIKTLNTQGEEKHVAAKGLRMCTTIANYLLPTLL